MGLEISAETIMDKYLGKEEKPRYLLEVFKAHNTKMEAMIGRGFAANTLKGYKSSVTHLENYLLKEYKKIDIDMRKIDHEFIV